MADTPDAPTGGSPTGGNTTGGNTTADQERYEEARRRVQAKKGFYASLLVYVVINVVFLFVAGWGWLWVTLFWGIGLAFHGWHVFGRHSAWMKGWEQRQMEKELARVEPPESV